MILAVSASALVASVYWALDGGFLAWIGCLFTAGMALLAARFPFSRGGAGDRMTAVSVDAGGNWALCDGAQWHRLTLDRIRVSPLGWMSLDGRVRSISRPASASGVVALSVWFDSVPPDAWRRLRIAAAWSTQRQDALLVSASARDPRLEVPV